MSTKSVEILISGRVQGVYFRKYAQIKGLELGLKGYVKNLPTGEVNAVIMGDDNQIEQFTQWCHKGSPLSKVTKVLVRDSQQIVEEEIFAIR